MAGVVEDGLLGVGGLGFDVFWVFQVLVDEELDLGGVGFVLVESVLF